MRDPTCLFHCRGAQDRQVVDDYPRFFNVYRQFDSPDRIGLLRLKRHMKQDYIIQGATRVVDSWKQLKNEVFDPIIGRFKFIHGNETKLKARLRSPSG